MTKFEAAAAIATILDGFSQEEKVFVLRTAADSHGLKAKSGGGGGNVAKEIARVLAADRARQGRRVQGMSSLGTMVDIDLEEADRLHDEAMGRHGDGDDDDEVASGIGNGIF